MQLDLHNGAHAGSTPVQSIVSKQTPQQRVNPIDAAAVRERIRAGDYAGAARLVLAAHGPEIFGFLIGALDDLEVAGVLYADVCQRVGTEIEGFGWGCSLRVWVYSLARRELQERRLRRKRGSGTASAEVVATVAETDSHRKAGLTDAIAAVRRTLSEEDREILILRIDRTLDWGEVAFTALGEEASPSAIASEAAAVKARLVELLERVERLTAEHVRLR